jgi:hypothetical protein
LDIPTQWEQTMSRWNAIEWTRCAQRVLCAAGLGIVISFGFLMPLSVTASAAPDGHMRIDATVAGKLELEHGAGWTRVARIEPGTQMLWCLPTGAYALRFIPDATGVALNGEATVWDDLTTRIEVGAEAGAIRTSAGEDDGRGVTLLLPASLLDMLPDEPARKLSALDTSTRWRPDLALDGMSLTPSAERRELTSLAGVASGDAVTSLSPGDPARGASHWLLSRALPQGRLAGEAMLRTPEAMDYAASGRLPEFGLLGVDLRGYGTLHFTRDNNASPRSRGERVLPHNDEQVLDISGEIELGPAVPGAIALPTGSTRLQGESALGEGSWGATLQFSAYGSNRNHYLEIYKRDSAHSPHEELASLWGRATTTVRLGARTRGVAAFGLRTYENSLADGVYEGAVREYYRPYDNAIADTSGLYWQGGDGGLLATPHVFDYYQWKRTEALAGELAFTHAAGNDMLLSWRTLAEQTTYRRFDHYSPTEIEPTNELEISDRALVIGYDPERGEPADGPVDPGSATSVRSAVTARTHIAHGVRLLARAGLFAFTSGESALVSIDDPLRGDQRLDASDLTGTSWHAMPEGYLGVRGGDSRSLAWWGLGYLQAYQPPLEALYGPRAYFAQQVPEGVLGNPDLRPERERGGEIGCAFPLPLYRLWQVNVAGYAGHLADVITIEAAQVPEGRGLYDDDTVPIYANGGALRRYGLHLDATTGKSRGGTWARLSYDYGHIESDRYEPPPLDLRGLSPDLPQGEYATEGYATPLGGLFDEWAGTGTTTPGSEYHPSNLDRKHRLSLAVVTPLPTSVIGEGWIVGGILAISSGRPFTQVGVYPAGLLPGANEVPRGAEDPAWEDVVAELWRNGVRMRNHVELDLALSRRWERGGNSITMAIETLNLLGIRNPRSVYRATGELDDDGCTSDPGCASDYLSEYDAAAYAERLEAAENYDRPWILRLRLTIEMFR